MIDAVEVIAQARASGMTLQPNGDRLTVRGPRPAVPLLDTLRQHKPEILAILEREREEIVWRVTALATRIPRTGPIWPVVVRPGDSRLDTPGHCSLCGDELPTWRLTSPWHRCTPCVVALHEALRQIREGLHAPAVTETEAEHEASTPEGRTTA